MVARMWLEVTCLWFLPRLNTDILNSAHPIGEYTGRERMASYPSGQRDLTVNQPAQPSGVRIPHSPRFVMGRALGVPFLGPPTSGSCELVPPVGLLRFDDVLAEDFPGVFVGDGNFGFVDEDDQRDSAVACAVSKVVHFARATE